MNLFADPRFRVFLIEVFNNRRLVVVGFVAINLFALTAAFSWPRGYSASTTILVSERNIIQPLMQGTAATTDVADRARMAREVINGRRVMNQVVNVAGWIRSDAPDSERELVIDSLTARTTIANVGRNLIKIEFRDADAERAFHTTRTLAEIFIQESIGAKAAESQAAFEFIDKQTQDYHEKLMAMEEGLKEYRIANIDTSAGNEGDFNQRINALQQRIEQSTQELRESEIKKRSLEKQLSGEAESSMVLSREGQHRQRIAELNNQLETLRLSYHDTYPDIVRIRNQIADLNEAVAADRKRRAQAGAAARPIVDESVINNPMYQQLKRELSQTQITIEMLNARIGEARQQMNAVLERGKQAHSGEATLAELTRDYQVTRDIYQDLLRRRENARVSMNMDKENQGLTFKIQEPATLPLEPSGLKFWHYIAIGLALGFVLPCGLIYGLIQLDPRVRQPITLTARRSLPMLVVVPHLWLPAEAVGIQREYYWYGIAVMTTIAIIIVAVLLRSIGVI
jgi:polysaccharide chain length determinant protein (PEP-CTERM system associated)